MHKDEQQQQQLDDTERKLLEKLFTEEGDEKQGWKFKIDEDMFTTTSVSQKVKLFSQTNC